VKVQFLADAGLNKAIVNGVFAPRAVHRFFATYAARLRHVIDPEVLALAAEQQRALVSHDVGRMPAHFPGIQKHWKTERRRVPYPQILDVGTAIDDLALIVDRFRSERVGEPIEWLPAVRESGGRKAG
jgi:hypothetical protein